MQFAPVSPLQVLTSVLSRFLKTRQGTKSSGTGGSCVTNESQKYLLPLFVQLLFLSVELIELIFFNISIYLSVCVPFQSSFFQYLYLSQCLRFLPLLGRSASGWAPEPPRATRSQPELYGFAPKIVSFPQISGSARAGLMLTWMGLFCTRALAN